jgi:gamma-glutamylcyclotransferase (GGCT)/AIG2-like uncharacterized protein YtfP
MARVKLAVYGSLKSSQNNSSLLGPTAKVLQKDVKIGDFSLYDLTLFPAAVRDFDGPGILCEIVEVDAARILILDNYEGASDNPPLFERELEILPSGEEVIIYVYARKIPNYSALIPSGRWEDALAKKG